MCMYRNLWVDKIKWIKGYDSNGTLKWGVLGLLFLNLKGIEITANELKI